MSILFSTDNNRGKMFLKITHSQRMRPASEGWRYNVTLSLIGWAHTQNDPCIQKQGHPHPRCQWVNWILNPFLSDSQHLYIRINVQHTHMLSFNERSSSRASSMYASTSAILASISLVWNYNNQLFALWKKHFLRKITNITTWILIT